MDMMKVFIWLVYPYLVLAIFGMGFIWQVNIPVFTTSEEYRKNQLIHKFFNRFLMILLILSFITGICVFIFYHVTNEPILIFHWVKSLVFLDPELEIIESISPLSRTHLILFSTFICLFAFSNKMKEVFKPIQFFKKKKKQK